MAYERYWDQSVEQYSDVFGTDNPDLTGFRDRGGKIIIWHGWADQLISAEGTVDYYKRVQERMGGAKKTSEVARLFMAPGIGHCGGGVGPAPYRSVRSPAHLGRREQSAGDATGGAPGPGGSDHAIASALSVPAGRQVQRIRKHGRRDQFQLQRGVLRGIRSIRVWPMSAVVCCQRL